MGVALLKFRDGLSTGTAGVAFPTAFGQDLIIENATSGGGSGIASWRITLCQAPPGCARERRPFVDPLSSFVIAESASSSLPQATLTSLGAGFYGCYRIMMEVWTGTSYTGTKDTDIRNAGVPTPNKGIILPPFQLEPEPLVQGLPGSKPNEMNFGSQYWGWSGPQYDVSLYPWRLVNEALLLIDTAGGGGPPLIHAVLSGLGQTAFTLPDAPTSGTVIMAVNGIVQSTSDFSVVGALVTYSGISLPTGASVVFYYWVSTGSGGGSGSYSVIVASHTLASGANADVTPLGWQATNVGRWDSPAAATVSGIAAITGTGMALKKLYNVGSYNITLQHENSGSLAANRLIIPGAVDLIVEPDDVVDMFYDSITTRWRVG